MLEAHEPLDARLKLVHAHGLSERHKPPLAALRAERVANVRDVRVGAAGAHAVREPVVDPARDAVERGVRGVHRHACRGEAEQGALQRVGERERGERLEDRGVVGDDERRRRGEGFGGDFCCEACGDLE